MICRHPLAYLLGLEGVALFRAFAGEYDREFIEARIAEIRALLDSVDLLGDGVEVPEITSIEGYNNRSVDYDERDNSLISLEQPIVREILERLPIGDALDAGCGTGRHAAYLAFLGHKVTGVDSSPGMLTKARAKVPQGTFHEADLHRLPVPDRQVDLVVCGLALTHVSELAPVISEFVRVLRPGGHLVISESPGLAFGGIGNPLVKIGPDGNAGYVSNRRHPTSEYLEIAVPLGLQVRSCVEPQLGYPMLDPDEKSPTDSIASGTPPDIWALHSWAAAATNATYRDQPAAIIWHFQLADR